MPAILQVAFRSSGPRGDEMTKPLRDLAASICVEPDFPWNIWTNSEDTEEAGGNYVLADRDATKAYGA